MMSTKIIKEILKLSREKTHYIEKIEIRSIPDILIETLLIVWKSSDIFKALKEQNFQPCISWHYHSEMSKK